jgi:hypothetical protein
VNFSATFEKKLKKNEMNFSTLQFRIELSNKVNCPEKKIVVHRNIVQKIIEKTQQKTHMV